MGDHPVKVPAELFAEWRNDAAGTQWMDSRTIAAKVADRAAQWGYDLREPELQQAADQELEACCEWVSGYCPRWPDGTKPEAKLRAARRPKPPTPAQQALAELEEITTELHDATGSAFTASAIRAALNRLAELEAQQ